MNKSLKSIAILLLSLVILSSCGDDDTVGVEDATKYGNVSVTLEGTRPDNVEFKETYNCRFTPGNNVQASGVSTQGNNYSFLVYRTNSGAVSDQGINYAGVQFAADHSGEEPVYTGGTLYLNLSIKSTKDYKYFMIDNSFPLPVDDVTSYSYNPDTGKLTLKFSTVIDGENNESTHDLTVTGTVSATVFEYTGESGS